MILAVGFLFSVKTMTTPTKKETTAQRVERLKRAMNPWDGLEEIRRFIAQDNPSAASRIRAVIRAAVERLADPESRSGRPGCWNPRAGGRQNPLHRRLPGLR